MNGNIVGFYWTRPVNWVGFTRLPQNADDAAKISKTIMYQRERVRCWAERDRSTVVTEVVYLERNPHVYSDGIKNKLQTAYDQCLKHKARLLYVDFAEDSGWRGNYWIRQFLRSSEIDHVSLSPKPIEIDGVRFDPIEHFRKWRDREGPQKEAVRWMALEGLRAVRGEVSEKRGQWAEMASILNLRGIRTVTGRTWTDESVRHSMKLLADEGDAAD